MGRKICYTGKPHPDYSVGKVLPGRLRKNSCQVQWDFHICIKPIYISSLCLSLEDMARNKNKSTRSEHAMNAGSLLSECIWHSYKMKKSYKPSSSREPSQLEMKMTLYLHTHWTPNTLEPRSSRYFLLWLSPHGDFSHLQFQDFHLQQNLFYHRDWRIGSRPNYIQPHELSPMNFSWALKANTGMLFFSCPNHPPSTKSNQIKDPYI